MSKMKNPFTPTSALGSKDALQSMLAALMQQQGLTQAVITTEMSAGVEGFWLEEEFDPKLDAVVITLVTDNKAPKQ